MKGLLSLFLLLWGANLFAAFPIGEVMKIQGEVLRQNLTATTTVEAKSLQEKELLYQGDQIKTGKKSFIKVKLLDETLLNLGPETIFVFEKIGTDSEKRDNLYRLTIGKLRAHVQKKAQQGEKIIFKSGEIPLGVRGTEFITSVAGEQKLTTDALVLSGKIDAGGTELNPGQLFNSDKGIWKTLSSDELKAIKDSEDGFIPESLLKGASAALSSVAGIAAGVATSALGSTLLSEQSPAPTQTSTVTVIEKHIVEVVKVKEVELPWDIKEALKNREKFKAQNRCYYWEYKILPGSYVPQRFRRERDCDDYQEGR